MQRNATRRQSILNVPKHTAVAWVEKADYGRLRQVMTDSALPRTFEEWLRGALEEERHLYLNDVRVTRVLMTAETFLVWSLDKGLVILDAAARSQFAMDQVKYRLRQ